RRLGRVHLPGVTLDPRQRHLRRALRRGIHRTVILAALGISRGDVVAVAGAGGKTTLVYRLAAEARASGLRVLGTTTTHMGTLDEAVTGPVLVEADGDTAGALEKALAREGRVTVL